jgi:hypothetical protein
VREDLPAVPFGDRLADREPESGAAIPSHQGGIHLIEALEDLLERVLGNPDAGIFDLQLDLPSVARQAQGHPATGGRELDRVATEMQCELSHLVTVGIHPSIGAVGNDLESYLANLGHRPEQAGGLLQSSAASTG